MRVRFNLPKVKLGLVRRIFQRFGPLLRPHRGQLVLSGVALLGSTGVAILRPWPLKVVIDYVLMPSRSGSSKSFLAPLSTVDPYLILGIAALTVVGITAVQGVLNYSHAVIAKTVGHKLVAEIRLLLFSHVQRLPMSYHDYRQTGDVLTRMTDDITLLENMLVSTVITIGSQILLVISMFCVMGWIDWQLTLVVLGITPLFVFAAFGFTVRIRESARRQRDRYGKIVAAIQESLSGIAHVKSFAQEKRREKLVSKAVSGDTKASIKTTRLTANYERVVDIITAVGMALILWLGAKKAFAGEISAGDLIVFLSYLRGIYRPIKGIARQSTRVAKATVRGEKILELLDIKPELDDNDEGLTARDIHGDFRFDSVGFSYLNDRPVLHDVTCRIPRDKTTIIIGPTGAGKSTIIKLLLRLYQPQSGSILLDERDIAEYRIHSLRKQISTLSQETFLFRSSIGENIAFGKRKVSQDDIVHAAQTVGADTFIEQLPEGYETLVGEGGATLSGGQRQLVSFARAALRDSKVMIFDEPASGLDVGSEQHAKEVLERLRVNRTLIMITHRLHFLDMADWVILVDDGRVVEEGTPEELELRQGKFCEFVKQLPSDRERVEAGRIAPVQEKK